MDEQEFIARLAELAIRDLIRVPLGAANMKEEGAVAGDIDPTGVRKRAWTRSCQQSFRKGSKSRRKRIPTRSSWIGGLERFWSACEGKVETATPSPWMSTALLTMTPAEPKRA